MGGLQSLLNAIHAGLLEEFSKEVISNFMVATKTGYPKTTTTNPFAISSHLVSLRSMGWCSKYQMTSSIEIYGFSSSLSLQPQSLVPSQQTEVKLIRPSMIQDCRLPSTISLVITLASGPKVQSSLVTKQSEVFGTMDGERITGHTWNLNCSNIISKALTQQRHWCTRAASANSV